MRPLDQQISQARSQLGGLESQHDKASYSEYGYEVSREISQLDRKIGQARSLIHRLERNRSHAAARLDSELAREEQVAIKVMAKLDSALQDVREKARAEIDRVGVPAHRLIESASRFVIELRGTLTRRAAQTQRALAQFIEVADSRCEASTMTFTFPLVTWI